MTFLSFLATFGGLLATTLFTCFKFLNTWIVSHCIRMSVVYPRTSGFKELQAIVNPQPHARVPLKQIAYDPSISTDALVKEMADVNLGPSGLADELRPIVETLFQQKDEFFIGQVDYIVIQKLGVEVLIISMGDNGRNRSMFIDLTGYRVAFLQWRLYVTLGSGLISAVLAYLAQHPEVVKAVMKDFE